MKIKVLVVEDKESLNRSIVGMLKKEGYIAFGTTDIDSTKEMFLAEKPHIILLDIMLPSGSGYDLISFFRKYNDSRILMLTALSDQESKRISYENGADDYITKPFDLYELIYKLGAIKRRILLQQNEYKVGDITFNIDSNLLTCKGKKTTLQPSQMKLLKRIYEKYEESSYLNKIEAVENVSHNVDESNRIQALVARLRKNLADIGSEEIIIETIYGKGYQMAVCLKDKSNE